MSRVATVDYSSLNKDELKTILDEKEISYKSTDTKTQLINLLEDRQ